MRRKKKSETLRHTGLSRSRHDHRQIEELAQLGMGEHIVAELGGRVVLDKLQEAELVVDD